VGGVVVVVALVEVGQVVTAVAGEVVVEVLLVLHCQRHRALIANHAGNHAALDHVHPEQYLFRKAHQIVPLHLSVDLYMTQEGVMVLVVNHMSGRFESGIDW
jgi:hypothetical protein